MHVDMRRLIRIAEGVELDYGNPPAGQPQPKLSAYSRYGAHYRIKPNDPRFGDNPLEEPLLDSDNTSSIERLHLMLNKAGVGDEEIKAHVALSDSGSHKVAARLGISPEDVAVLLASLEQSLKDADADMLEDEEGPMGEAAMQPPAETYSVESDALGSQTVRSARTGKTRFFQGSASQDLTAELKQPGANQQAILQRMMMEAETSFKSQIAAETGSYNFPWKLGTKTGFGTAFYRTDAAEPAVSIASVRDHAGNDVKLSDADTKTLKQQAMQFIKNA